MERTHHHGVRHLEKSLLRTWTVVVPETIEKEKRTHQSEWVMRRTTTGEVVLVSWKVWNVERVVVGVLRSTFVDTQQTQQQS